MKLSELRDGEAALVRTPAQYQACNNKGHILGYSGFRAEEIEALRERLQEKGYALLTDVSIY